MANDASDEVTKLRAERDAADRRTVGILGLLKKILLKLRVLPNDNARPAAELIDAAQDWLANSADRSGAQCDPPCGPRRKLRIAVVANLDEKTCGVPDSAIAEFIRFDLVGAHGNPVIQARYCPWCSRAITNAALTQILDVKGAIGPPGAEKDTPPAGTTQ